MHKLTNVHSINTTNKKKLKLKKKQLRLECIKIVWIFRNLSKQIKLYQRWMPWYLAVIHPSPLKWFFFKFLFILSLAVLGLHCCTRAFSSCGELALLSRCRTRAELFYHMWSLPRTMIKPMPPALAGGPPGKCLKCFSGDGLIPPVVDPNL